MQRWMPAAWDRRPVSAASACDEWRWFLAEGTRRHQPYPQLCIGRRAGRLARVSMIASQAPCGDPNRCGCISALRSGRTRTRPGCALRRKALYVNIYHGEPAASPLPVKRLESPARAVSRLPVGHSPALGPDLQPCTLTYYGRYHTLHASQPLGLLTNHNFQYNFQYLLHM